MVLSKLIIKKHPLRPNGHLSSTSEQSIAELLVKNYQGFNSVLLRDIIEFYVQTDTKLTASFFREMSKFEIVDVTEAVEEKTLSFKKHGNGRLIHLDNQTMLVNGKNVSPKIGFFVVDGDTCCQYFVETSKNRIIQYHVAAGIPSVDRYVDRESLTTSQFWVRSENGTSTVVNQFHLELHSPECMFSKPDMIKQLISLILEDVKPDQLNQLVCTLNEDTLRELSKSVFAEIEVSPNKTSDYSRKMKIDKEGKMFYGKRDGSKACRAFPSGDRAVCAEVVLSSLDFDTGLTEHLITDTTNNCRFAWKSNHSLEIEGFLSVRITFQVKDGIVSKWNIDEDPRPILTGVPSTSSARLERPFTFDTDSNLHIMNTFETAHHEQLRIEDESERTPDPTRLEMSDKSVPSPRKDNTLLIEEEDKILSPEEHGDFVTEMGGREMAETAGSEDRSNISDALRLLEQDAVAPSLDPSPSEQFQLAQQQLLVNSPTPSPTRTGEEQLSLHSSKRSASDEKLKTPAVKRSKLSDADSTEADMSQIIDDDVDQDEEGFKCEDVDVSLKKLKMVLMRGRLMRDYEPKKLAEMKKTCIPQLFNMKKATIPVFFCIDLESFEQQLVCIESNHRQTVLKWAYDDVIPDLEVKIQLICIGEELFRELWDVSIEIPPSLPALENEDEYNVPTINPKLSRIIMEYYANSEIRNLSVFREVDEALFMISSLKSLISSEKRNQLRKNPVMRNRFYDHLAEKGLVKIRTSNTTEMLSYITFFMKTLTQGIFIELLDIGKAPRTRRMPTQILKASCVDDAKTAKILAKYKAKGEKGNIVQLEQQINKLANGKSNVVESTKRGNDESGSLLDGLNIQYNTKVEEVPSKSRCIFVHNVDVRILLPLLLKDCTILIVQPTERFLVPSGYPSKRGVLSGKIFGRNGFNHYIVVGSRVKETPEGEMTWSTLNSLVKLYYGSEGDTKTKTISDFTMYTVSANSQ
ncbi:unnamed protein product [Caenorhabditis nigoni]